MTVVHQYLGRDGRASAAWRIAAGWYLTVHLDAADGVAHMTGCAIDHLGERTERELDDWLQARHESMSDVPVPPVEPFRYRWMRDIGQEYEQQLRRILLGEMPGLEFMADRAFAKRPRRRRNTERDEWHYLRVAERYVSEAENSLERLAELEQVPWTTAKEWIHQAAQLGLLTRPGKGRRGVRQLTPKAIEMRQQRKDQA